MIMGIPAQNPLLQEPYTTSPTTNPPVGRVPRPDEDPTIRQ
jgi:hypothetical protein